MRTLILKTENKIEILVEKKFAMKYLFTIQNFHKSKLPLFCQFNFLKNNIYVNKGTLQV